MSAGTVELDAHTAMLTLCVFLFISFPFGVATASTIRVGNLLGAGLGQQVDPCCRVPASSHAQGTGCLLISHGICW